MGPKIKDFEDRFLEYSIFYNLQTLAYFIIVR